MLLFLEHRDRELEVAGAVGRSLRTRHGMSVAIASTIFHPLLATFRVRPRVVVFPSLGFDQGSVVSLFRARYGQAVTYVNLNLEQVLSPANRVYRRPRDPFALETLKHFCWGTRFRDFLVESGVAERNIFVTGKPALRLLQDKVEHGRAAMRGALADRFGLPAGGRWLFFPMTCRWAFASDYHIQTNIEAGYDIEMARHQRRYVTDTVNAVFRWIAGLGAAGAASDQLIVLRPHPSVSVEQYRQRFQELVGGVPPYVHLSKELSAQEWLVASDGCFTNFSSLALDAACAGVPAYLLEPEPFPPHLLVDWFEGFRRVRSGEELATRVLDPGQGQAIGSALLQEQVALDLDGVEETARQLAALAGEAPGGRGSKAKLLRAVAVSPRRPLGSLLRWMAASAGVNPFGVVRPGLMPDFFRAGDIASLLGERNADLAGRTA